MNLQQILQASLDVAEMVQQDMSRTDLEREKAEQLQNEEYAKQHAPLTVAFHQEWKSHVMVQSYHLPYEKAVSKSFSSRYECEKAAKEVIRQAHDLANRYVTAGDSKSVSRRVAAEYAETVQFIFKNNQEALQSCCKALGKSDTYEKIVQLVNNCEKTLRAVYDEELTDSRDYYEMYRLDYFYDQIEIEENDCRISEGEIFRALEAVLADNIQYTYTGVWSAISELEKDLNGNLTTFYRRAYAEYTNYIAKIEQLLDSLDADFYKTKSEEKKDNPINNAILNMMKQENG